MNIDDTILAFRCCIQIPPDCAKCPQQGPGLGIVCKQAVKDDVSYWLNVAKESVHDGQSNKNRLGG